MQTIETVRLLLMEGANVERYFENETPLHYAVYLSNVELAKALIDEGAYVDRAEKLHGKTPLHRAA